MIPLKRDLTPYEIEILREFLGGDIYRRNEHYYEPNISPSEILFLTSHGLLEIKKDNSQKRSKTDLELKTTPEGIEEINRRTIKIL